MEKRVDPAPDRKLQLSFRKGKGKGRKELQPLSGGSLACSTNQSTDKRAHTAWKCCLLSTKQATSFLY